MKILNLLKRITGVSTPLGGISWEPVEKPSIAKFQKQIYLTEGDNDEFIAFLTDNDKKIVALNLSLDASVSTERQNKIIEKHPDLFEKIHSCKLNGLTMPLSNQHKGMTYLTFYFSNPYPLLHSSGGTGIFTMPLRGMFEVSRTFHGGPSVAFHLKEVAASLENQIHAYAD